MRRQRDDLVDERHQQQHQDKKEPEQARVLHFGIPRRGPPSRWPAGLVVAAAAPPTRTNWSTRASYGPRPVCRGLSLGGRPAQADRGTSDATRTYRAPQALTAMLPRLACFID